MVSPFHMLICLSLYSLKSIVVSGTVLMYLSKLNGETSGWLKVSAIMEWESKEKEGIVGCI